MTVLGASEPDTPKRRCCDFDFRKLEGSDKINIHIVLNLIFGVA